MRNLARARKKPEFDTEHTAKVVQSIICAACVIAMQSLETLLSRYAKTVSISVVAVLAAVLASTTQMDVVEKGTTEIIHGLGANSALPPGLVLSAGVLQVLFRRHQQHLCVSNVLKVTWNLLH